MRYLSLLLIACLAVACTSAAPVSSASAAEHPEARLYDSTRDASADVDAALAQGEAERKITLVVMGANWCHDSRALAGWFTTDADIMGVLERNFVVTYVDVGQKDRNIDIAQRFGIEEIVGTPTMVMIDYDGSVLNKVTAKDWRNSASRSKEDIIYELEEVALF
ncbi:MAG: thioredoxin family protein [Litorimonas sp.]